MSKARTDDAHGKALDLWDAPEDAGEPLVCIATSFTFDSTFFETECVGRFLAMDSHPSESESVGYLIEREEKLASAQVCALIDRRHARDKESLRWDIIGVLVPRAIQHAKVALLVWRNRARVVVGSGNLTEPGYRRNLEVCGAIEISREEGGDRESVLATIEFLESVLSFAVGEEGPDTPKKRAADALVAARNHIKTWRQTDRSTRTPTPVFGLPGKSVLDQLHDLWPASAPPRSAHILSPFFDAPPNDSKALEALLPLLAKKRPRDMYVYVRSETQPDGRKRVFAPLGMVRKAEELCDVSVFEVSVVQSGELRDLHAKMVSLESDDWRLLLAGSSNFTGSGIAAPNGRGSCEANLVYRLRESDRESRRLFDRIWPDCEETPLDAESDQLIWDPIPEEREGGGDEVPLPACFRDAIYAPAEPAVLSITLEAPLPDEWAVRDQEGALVLGSATRHGAGRHVIPWGARAVPFIIKVEWRQGGETLTANWPVNVSNPRTLPPPDALRDLSLEELLEILSSTRPIHESVVRVLEKRIKGRRTQIELDPLRRFDSPAFLLRRTRRVAIALERLRERLQRPALSPDSFGWRLEGAVGPITLAHAFVQDARTSGESRFYLAELALALHRVDIGQTSAGGLAPAVVREMLATAVATIQDLATKIPGEPSQGALEKYVEAAFAEAQAC